MRLFRYLKGSCDWRVEAKRRCDGEVCEFLGWKVRIVYIYMWEGGERRGGTRIVTVGDESGWV